jgi:hypothetical protein
MKKEGRLCGESTGDNVDGTTNIIPAMRLQTLRDGYKSILDHIYAPEPFYQRVKTFLREYKRPKIRARIQFSHILALIRSVYRIGILSPGRLQYWKLLIWTQFRRPRLIPEAIVFAIYGYHFRKICEQHVV